MGKYKFVTSVRLSWNNWFKLDNRLHTNFPTIAAPITLWKRNVDFFYLAKFRTRDLWLQKTAGGHSWRAMLTSTGHLFLKPTLLELKTRNKIDLENYKFNYKHLRGAMKQGRSTCGTFKPFNLTYLHILRS